MTACIKVYPKIGQVDGASEGIIEIPDYDTALITVPSGTYATQTNFIAALTMTGIGFMKIRVGATSYTIPILLNS